MEHYYAKRRVFVTDGGPRYHVFSFTQDKNGDGSIYMSSPNFSEIKWIAVEANQGIPRLSIVESPGDGKLSVHASGMASIRSHEDPLTRRIVVHGNYLLNLAKSAAGVRHLFTIYMAEPRALPISPAQNRESDYIINNSKSLSPFVMIFFAVPRMPNFTVSIQGSFNIDDLESIPPESGSGVIELPYHLLLWFVYKTKYMDKWPKFPIVCYYDGFSVPLFIGKDEGKFLMELFNPKYELNGSKLTINLEFENNVGVKDIS